MIRAGTARYIFRFRYTYLYKNNCFYIYLFFYLYFYIRKIFKILILLHGSVQFHTDKRGGINDV